MAIPVSIPGTQSADTGSGVREVTARRQGEPHQGEGSARAGGAESFLRLLQGAAETKGTEESGSEEQGDASAALRLLARLFDLDPSQLASRADQAQLEGKDGLLALLQDLGGQGEGVEALSRLLGGKEGSLNRGAMAELREILGQNGGVKGTTEGVLARLASLLQESGSQGKTFAEGGGKEMRAAFLADGSGAKQGRSGEGLEGLLRRALSAEGKGNASPQAGEMNKLAAALREVSDQGRLSGEQLQRLAQDLQSISAEKQEQGKSGTESGRLGRLAAALQQNADSGQSRAQLARLFLDSFGRGERSGSDTGQGGSRSKGDISFLQQDKSLLQTLARQGSAGNRGTEMSPGQSSGQSGQSEGARPGVSLQAEQWGSLLSSLRGAGEASGSGGTSRASPAPGASSVMDNQVLQQVIGKLQTDLQRGSHRINLRMHPPELGRVQMQLVSEDSGMKLQLQVQNAQVQGILERNMPALRQALEQQNLDFDSIQVSVDSGREGDSGQSFGEREPGFSFRGGWKGYPEAGSEEAESGIPAARPGHEAGISLRV